jgi:class 3 adenylate cyclase
MAVNIAARLCDRAGRGKTLASAEVVALAGEFDFVEAGSLELKGLSRPVLGFRLANP